jgi:hypothetical protein
VENGQDYRAAHRLWDAPGGGKLDDLFLALHGAPFFQNQPLKTAQPGEFLEWHRSEVFRGIARS